MRVQSLVQEDPLEKETVTHSNILAWENPMHRGAWWATFHGVTESDTTERLHFTSLLHYTGEVLLPFAIDK